jgi:4-amino-4-deoxy-L-arabinose transferase-like glycosyltransferase
LAAFNLFYNLGSFPIYSWDEARHGVNAYEMIKKNNYIVSTYGYNIDYWNLKPPISYWAIILGYRLAGFNPFGLRLFSAISAIATIILISLFTLVRSGRLASLISASVLTTSISYITEHCARTGDADSIFVLFFSASILSLMMIDKNIKWLYSAGVTFALAFLTKSWHAGGVVVIGVVYLFLTRRLFKLSRRELLLAILSCTAPIFIWATLRYSQDRLTFFKAMVGFDLIARTSKTLEGHIGDLYFYIDVLKDSYFYWLIVLSGTTLAVTSIIQPKTVGYRKSEYALGIVLWIAIPFLLYTIAKTKISWYMLPLYPAMAIGIGTASQQLLKYKKGNLILQALVSLMIIFSLFRNETFIIGRISNPKAEPAQELIKMVGEQQQYRGRKIYIHHFEQSYWLSADLYGDMNTVEGGVEGFLKDNTKGVLLFITKENKRDLGKEIDSLKVVGENQAAYIFSK